MKLSIKSIFITLLMCCTLFLAIDSTWHLFKNGITYSKLGLLVMSGTMLSFFGSVYILQPARTSKQLLNFSLVIIIGITIIIYDSIINTTNLSAFIVGLSLLCAWMLFVFWQSSLGDRTNLILNVGSSFPKATLENSDKTPVNTENFLGKPTIYLFYRGNWCALCMGQINEVVEKYKTLENKKANLVFISPQPHRFSEKLAKKYGLDFYFLTDPKNTVAKKLGIDDDTGIPLGFQLLGFSSETVLPTVIVTNKRGEIVYADLTDNYRVRPEPDTFLRILEDKIA